MLQLTKRTEYGLIALVHLMDHADRRLAAIEGQPSTTAPAEIGVFASVREIGEQYPVPRRLLAEVLKDLCRAGLVDSQRGPSGGYALGRPADQITLGEVVAALEGRPSLTGCEVADLAADAHCDVESVCPIKSPIARVRTGLWNLLEQTTLRDLGSGRGLGSHAHGDTALDTEWPTTPLARPSQIQQ